MFVENGHDQYYLNLQTKKVNTILLKLKIQARIIVLKIRKELQKTGSQVVFTSTRKLNNTLYSKKIQLLPNSYPSVYEISYG